MLTEIISALGWSLCILYTRTAVRYDYDTITQAAKRYTHQTYFLLLIITNIIIIIILAGRLQ